MKELKDFNTEKSIYIGKVLNHIHYKKLHTRIYEEISAHLDDMHEDYSNIYDDEKEITKRVFEEMGHPHYLGLELKKANKTILFWVRMFKIACAVLTLPIIYLSIVAVSLVESEISHYFNAYDIEKAEHHIMEYYNDGEPIKLLTEVEKDGIIYKFYIPQNQSEDDLKVYYTKSIDVFGISVKDKFSGFGGGHMGNSTRSTDAVLLLTEGIPNSDYDCLYFFSKSYDTKYIKIYYEPFLDNKVEPYWSDYIEIPQNGTTDNPKWLLIECPDGYEWNKYERFDENKEVIE